MPLKAGLDLECIISELNRMLPQLSSFIDAFNNTVAQNGINVVTDAQGSMSIDVPSKMSDDAADKISNKLSIIDRLINSHGSSINDLFKEGLMLENKIKQFDNSYTSQLNEHITKFKELNSSYKH
jgi:hypothetical protein